MTHRIYVPPRGPANSRIMLVGEAPGEQEEASKRPFVGAAGHVLAGMLHDAGIVEHECFITNVARFRPKGNDISEFLTDRRKVGEANGWRFRDGMWLAPFMLEHLAALRHEIEECQPNVIVAFGNTALWALTGRMGVTKWQGSEMECSLTRREDGTPYKVVPCVHPAAIIRMWEDRFQTVHYLRSRVKRESYYPEMRQPARAFVIRPTIECVTQTLDYLEHQLNTNTRFKIAVDIETRRGETACIGLAWSKMNAICIPILCIERPEGYWSLEEETIIVARLRDILTHPNAYVIGQNFIYDAQYLARRWGFVPRVELDTMVWHHTVWPGLAKALDFQSSLYSEHYTYWKDEGKEWTNRMAEDELWHYNCLDCVYTYENAQYLANCVVPKFGLQKQVDFQQRLFYPVLRMMLRGVRIDTTRRATFDAEITAAINEREKYIEYLLGHPINIRSPQKLHWLFYDDLKVQPVLDRKTKRPTLNDDALKTIAKREPLLQPLVEAINDVRSLSVFRSTFVQAELDTGDRLRCSYNLAGTETFRFSSSKDAFGKGCNLQNVPKGSDVGPQVRKMFVPDEGYTIMDWDLDRADLQVVVWESDEAELKQMLREGVDMHTENAKVLGCSRQLAKTWVHGTNYGGSPRTMAINCGITVHQSESMNARWFAKWTGIRHWHNRIKAELDARHCVTNAFGYRRFYFDRSPELSKALAWIPQSTVALVINHGLLNIEDHLTDVQLLLQVHDSLVMQVPTHRVREFVPLIRQELSIVIPYPDPLVIPVSCKASEMSWGDAEKLVFKEEVAA